MKKSCAIAFRITKTLDFALANVLIGLKKYNKKFWDDIIVYHDGLTKECINNINKIVEIHPILFNNRIITFAKFECFNLLKQYQKVIFLDVDIIIQKNIEDIIYFADETGFAATYNNSELNEQNFLDIIEGYEMLIPSLNTGIIVLNDNLPNYEKLTKECYRLLEKYENKLRNKEQAILNMLAEDKKLKIKPISIEHYNVYPSIETYKNSKIIHSQGKNKFWNSYNLNKLYPEWNENNEEWEKITNKKVINILPEISVIMTINDRIEFLKESIESILKQSFKDFEFIIVLEYSKEQLNIEKYINKFADKRIKIIKNNKKVGIAESLNVAIKSSKGKYIARMDDDDISVKNRLEMQYNYLEEHKETAIIGSYMQLFMKNNDLWKIPCNYEELKIRALTTTPLFHPTVMMRKEIMTKNNYYYDSDYITEDYELWCRIIDKVKIENIPETLLYYRISNINTTSTKNKEVQKCHDEIVKRNFLEKLNLNLSNDEIKILQYEEILENIYNREALHKMKINCINKIIEANKICGRFDEYKLYEFLNIEYCKGLKKYIKKSKILIKKYLLSPLYKPLKNKILYLLNETKLELNKKNIEIDNRLTILEKRTLEENNKK